MLVLHNAGHPLQAGGSGVKRGTIHTSNHFWFSKLNRLLQDASPMRAIDGPFFEEVIHRELVKCGSNISKIGVSCPAIMCHHRGQRC